MASWTRSWRRCWSRRRSPPWFKARKVLAARAGKVLVVNLQPQIRKVFDIVKAVPVSDVFASVAELDAYLDAMQRKVLEGDDEAP